MIYSKTRVFNQGSVTDMYADMMSMYSESTGTDSIPAQTWHLKNVGTVQVRIGPSDVDYTSSYPGFPLAPGDEEIIEIPADERLYVIAEADNAHIAELLITN